MIEIPRLRCKSRKVPMMVARSDASTIGDGLVGDDQAAGS